MPRVNSQPNAYFYIIISTTRFVASLSHPNIDANGARWITDEWNIFYLSEQKSFLPAQGYAVGCWLEFNGSFNTN